MHELKISTKYPECYWLTYHDEQLSSYEFMKMETINYNGELIFLANKNAKKNKLIELDFLYTSGPNVISPRLFSILSSNKSILNDIQLIDASIILNDGQKLTGYKAVNITRSISAIDTERSPSRLLLTYLPNGPVFFEKIILRTNITEDFMMAKCNESHEIIVISDELKSILVKNQVSGLNLE